MFVRKAVIAAIPVVNASLQVAQEIAPSVGFGVRATGTALAGLTAYATATEGYGYGTAVGCIAGIGVTAAFAATFWKTWPH